MEGYKKWLVVRRAEVNRRFFIANVFAALAADCLAHLVPLPNFTRVDHYVPHYDKPSF